ncbi:hypothetical protein ZIOFF_003626 [Zingiber officinale]|uniref:Uncharacterized protein n=1 Tax=Zingiber officinale TaxID=94328 RepID=A0A8J5LWT3_ZINOF|nr:hypothetical protein ZIOFF_003626 [Zingiber officinale]
METNPVATRAGVGVEPAGVSGEAATATAEGRDIGWTGGRKRPLVRRRRKKAEAEKESMIGAGACGVGGEVVSRERAIERRRRENEGSATDRITYY